MATDLIASSPPLPQHELQYHNHAGVIPPDTSFMPGPPSVASDGVSVVSGIAATGYPPYMASVSPKPDYLSQHNASRVTSELFRAQKEIESEDEDNNKDEPERVEISEGAVNYVNNFLDKLLHDILSVAHSTQLPNLRQAVADTLKKSLGRDAVAAADANLEDLLAVESDDEERPVTRGSNSKWNLEYTWRRARLRVMMRSEKSDFDIDDDERYVQQEALVSPGRRYSDNAAVISLQSEIFLAGVLDYVSDQLLNLAIIPASIRRRRESKRSTAQQANPAVLFVEEPDLEKGVLNSPLDKLWRIWRKTQRSRGWSNAGSPRHGYSFSDVSSPTTTRRGSNTWADGPYHSAIPQDLQTPRGMPGEFIETPGVEFGQRETVPDMDDHPEYIIASNIPIPVGGRDIDEIEVPGLAKDPDEWEEEMVEEPRRRSYLPPSRKPVQQPDVRPAMTRKRSSSAPQPVVRDYATNRTAQVLELPAESQRPGDQRIPPPENTFSMAVEDKAHVDRNGEAPETVESSGKAVVDTKSREDKDSTGGQSPKTSSGKFAAAIGAGAAAVGGVRAMAAVSKFQRQERSSPERIMEQDRSEGSPKPNRRNREAAVGMGYPNGISIPGQAKQQTYDHKPEAELPANEIPPPTAGSSPEDLKLRAASPSSETETSEILSPRDFMTSRNLPHTRSTRSDSLPTQLQSQSSRDKPMPPIRGKLQTSGIEESPEESSPVSPLTSAEAGIDKMPEPSKLSNVTTVTNIDRSGMRKTSAPAGRLTDDLARARGSPKVRQASLGERESQAEGSPVHRKESLRRIAVERNGSLVSLVDESTHKIRSKAPMTSSSITSAEDFDSLLSGGETIKMTLSPQSVREAPSLPGSRNGSIDSTAFGKDEAGNVLRKQPAGSKSPSMKSPSMRSPSMKSPSIGSSDKSKRGRTGSDATEKSRRSISRPSLRNKSRTRAGFTAREPTVQTDSTRDFADFIRSTGPDREPQTLVPALTNRSSIGPTDRQQSVSGTSVIGQQPAADDQPPLPQVTENTGIKYKRSLAPREARGSEPSGNAGLIDFIRTGPGSGKNNVPSKDIAPFRYSMDSDDIKVEPISLDGPPGGGMTPSMSNMSFSGGHRSSISTMATMQTMTTYASHAPLVSGRNPSQGGQGDQGSSTPKVAPKKAKQSSTTVDADGITRYRNKDPYAMDFSDDDDDFEDEAPTATALPRKPVAGGGSNTNTDNSSGSLGDFMRDNNISAAVNMSDTNNHSPSKQQQQQQQQQQTTSAPRRVEAPPASGLALNGVSYNPSAASNPTTTSASGPSPASRAPAVGAPTQAKPAGVIPRNPNRPKFEVRDAGGARRAGAGGIGGGGGGGGGSSTRDLADFLKNSGPPEPAAPRERFGGGAPSPNIGGGMSEKVGKEEGGVKKKFWQRKKYLDMP